MNKNDKLRAIAKSFSLDLEDLESEEYGDYDTDPIDDYLELSLEDIGDFNQVVVCEVVDSKLLELKQVYPVWETHGSYYEDINHFPNTQQQQQLKEIANTPLQDIVADFPKQDVVVLFHGHPRLRCPLYLY